MCSCLNKKKKENFIEQKLKTQNLPPGVLTDAKGPPIGDPVLLFNKLLKKFCKTPSPPTVPGLPSIWNARHKLKLRNNGNSIILIIFVKYNINKKII